MYTTRIKHKDIVEFSIDFPREFSTDHNLFIQGWVAVHQGATAYLRLSESGSVVYPLNQNRGDVVEYLQSKNIGCFNTCGFSYSIENVDKVEIVYKDKHGYETVLAEVHKSINTFTNDELFFSKEHYNFFDFKKNSVDSEVKFLANQLLSHKYDLSLELITNLVSSGDILTMRHPVYPDILTHATLSKRISVCNFIIYSSKCRNYEWVLVQIENFVEAILLPEVAFYVFSDSVRGLILNALPNNFFELFELSRQSNFNNKSVFFLGHPRPFHFLYDQYVNYSKISEQVRLNCLFDDNSFFIGKNSSASASDDNCLVRFWLLNVGLNYIVRQNLCVPDYYLNEFESKLLPAFERSDSDLFSDDSKNLKIWIGITGQKRAWKEQIAGYVSILNNLSYHFERVEAFVDGWTAVNKAVANDVDDLHIVQLISNSVNSNVFIKNLVGIDYEEKIFHAIGCACFIANAGSGSIVPLRIAKLKGAIHSNPGLVTFPFDEKDSLYANVKLFLSDGSDGLGMDSDYSIDWRDIFKHIVTILGVREYFDISSLDNYPLTNLDNQRIGFGDVYEIENINIDIISMLYDQMAYLNCYIFCLIFLKMHPGNRVVNKYLFNSRLRTDDIYAVYIEKCINNGRFSKSIKGIHLDEIK